VLLLACLTACGGSGGGSAPPRSADAPIALERVFPALAFERPVALVQAPGATRRWFVVEQAGLIRVFESPPDVSSADTFIDISTRVEDSCNECGLFGIAFAPDFASSGHAYLSYTSSTPGLTSHVARFTSTDGGQTLDPDSEQIVLTLPQPFPNHNGGHIVFGPDDGFLYVGFGDGGSGNDPGNRAQNTTNLFGTIIRIDVASLPYAIPADNPFEGNMRCQSGSGPEACPEIFAWGLRNPWRFSFDRSTGELWAGDVGQNAWEEVDLVVNSGNYGWSIREGAHCTNLAGRPCTTAGLIDPVAEYGRDLGRSVTGGYVYRGTQVQPLIGSYVFGDYVSGRIFRLAPGGTEPEELLHTDVLISSFAEDADGEIYVVDHSGPLYRIVPAP
jgi:glucose/arabinose dehydrogenase